MNSFEDRKKGFEKKFVHDEEKEFKISAKKNKFLGQWAAKIMNMSEDQEKEYIQSVIKADFAEVGDEDVFRKLKEDLKNYKVEDQEIRDKMKVFYENAKNESK
ncbi:MAG: hypothetical protein CMI84_02735 [Candidatus Pelagibacter sp.]|nr:hypothetical protein [Candidatus Pelagibacter sp.]|tara:strand:+ start:325 stop:633 length:309 start_codon:yes stop_codon:yes gene_type:complete